MTIQDALKHRVRFLRLPQWAEGAHLELPLLPDGQHGPWVTVRDPSGETQLLITEFLRDPESRYEAALPPCALTGNSNSKK